MYVASLLIEFQVMIDDPVPEDRAATRLPRYLQLLWERETPGRRGPRPGKTIHEIGAAAVAIADAHGLDAVSMKSVAARIGLTPMSLYRYVDGKDELIAVMRDIAMGPPDYARPGSGWRDGLTAWVRAATNVRLAHPWLVEADTGAPPLTPNVLSWTDAGLAELADTPLTSQQRFSTLLAVDSWAHQHVQQSLQMGLLGETDPDSPAGRYTQDIGLLVDPARLPHLAREQRLVTDDAPFFEEEFAFGLALLLDGLAALIERRSAG